MLTYIIDGFNLVHRINDVKRSLTPHRDLIRYIKENRLVGSQNNRVIVVYDGHENDDVKYESQFQVRFSYDETADEVIKSIVKSYENKDKLIVVSDDREVRDAARLEGASICRTGAFLSKKKVLKGPDVPDRDEKDINCSEMIDITEELEKIWVDKKN